MLRSNMKHLRKKDPIPSEKHNKPLVKVFEWLDGSMEVKEITFESVREAKEYIKSINSKDVHIKIYNEHRELVHSENREKGHHHSPYQYA